MNRRSLLDSLQLGDLVRAAESNSALLRTDVERVLAAHNPMAAAALADLRRAAVTDVRVTYPVTLRVRAPMLTMPHEDATKVSHPLGEVAGIEATEMQLVGSLPVDAKLDQVLETVQPVAAARPDLPLRAFSAEDVIDLVRRERMAYADVLTPLAKAGVAILDWRPGGECTQETLRVHKAAHEAGIRTYAPISYARGGVGKAFLDRLFGIRALATTSRGFASAILLPERTEGASPLEGTAGTEDWTAMALARLALDDLVPHFSVDAHVVGHKLGATLLSCGADDFVGAQAARAWAPPTDDGPRPLNPDRVVKHVIEARRSPVRRDGIFVAAR